MSTPQALIPPPPRWRPGKSRGSRREPVQEVVRLLAREAVSPETMVDSTFEILAKRDPGEAVAWRAKMKSEMASLRLRVALGVSAYGPKLARSGALGIRRTRARPLRPRRRRTRTTAASRGDPDPEPDPDLARSPLPALVWAASRARRTYGLPGRIARAHGPRAAGAHRQTPARTGAMGLNMSRERYRREADPGLGTPGRSASVRAALAPVFATRSDPEQIARLRRVFLGDPTGEVDALGDAIVALLANGLPRTGREVAKGIRRRKLDVEALLRRDRRFIRVPAPPDRSRQARTWTLAPEDEGPVGTSAEGEA
jgi:hypothetical protein